MADFCRALKSVLRHEGLYADDPRDSGGETYRGVSRIHHPQWEGWKIIDSLRAKSDFPKTLPAHTDLNALLASFYRAQFWRRVDGDKLADQLLAEELFDTAVHLGPGRAVGFLQRSLNALNRNEALYGDLREDGVFGKNTRRALRIFLAQDPLETLLTCLNILQGMHYLERLRERPDQELFARGWLARITFTKSPN